MAVAFNDCEDELQLRFDDQYEQTDGDLLGSGTFGQVSKAKLRRTDTFVALKEERLNVEEGLLQHTIREVSALRKLKHANIIELSDVFHFRTKVILVFELLDQDLSAFMRTRPQGRQLDPWMIKTFCLQLCRGIDFCHASGFMHRDVAPPNLLIDSRSRLKIAGWSLVREHAPPRGNYTRPVVTLWYRAPELLLGSPHYSTPVDLWSVGCILGQMARGCPLFAGDSEFGTIIKIYQKLGTPTPQTWAGVADMPDHKPTFPMFEARGWEADTRARLGTDGTHLLEQLMVYEPKERTSARQALQHPFFNEAMLPMTRAGRHARCPQCEATWQLPWPISGTCTRCPGSIAVLTEE